jgi:dTDP-4-amino-4,6-dideoxygalactose transaminase
MAERGFGCVSHYEPLHAAPAGQRFGEGSPPVPVTEHVAPRLVRLPLFSSLDEKTAAEVAAAFLEAVEATSQS